MSFIKSPLSGKSLFLAIGLALLAFAGAGLAQPAQKPLLSRDGGGVKPNIMLTMDDSGSMLFQHMPENTVYVGSYSLASPVGTNSVMMDPGDNANLASFFIGTVAAQPGTSNYRQKLMRSPDTNTIYYNPEVRYFPWALATYPLLPAATSTNLAGRKTNSPVAAAYRDPMNPAGGGTINLTNVRSGSTKVNTTWCYQNSSSSCASSSENFDPGLYFRLNKNISGAYLDPTVAANYTQYSINASAATTYTKFPARLDCSGAVCTRDEERQNFANWFTYYRTRNLLVKGALGESFAESADNFRIGWGRINKSNSTSIDGVNTTVIESGVRDFTSTTKSNLYTWLYALPANGGTPLPGAMRAVGEYYSRSDNKGPWTDNPGVTNATADKTCRRAYNIMVTDGYWNVNATSVGNSDNTAGATISGSGGAQFTYSPVRPYKDGNTDTLADYAMEYWKKDLRPTLTNNVKSSLQDPAFWQHMVNFMVGLGVRGTLNPATDLPALTAGTKVWGTDEIDDLWHSALNSRGDFFSAKDPVELANAISTAVGRASADPYKEGGVATVSAVLQDNNRKYVPLYNIGSWNGDVQAYKLDKNGIAGAQAWSAEAKLPAWATRNIVTWSTDAVPALGVPFTSTGMGTTNLTNLGSLVTVPTSTAADLVDFLRGDRSKEGDAKPFRARKGALGDFGNSNPLLVQGLVDMGYGTLPTAQGGADTRYADFVTAKAARVATLFVGGNDGMLHAFKDTVDVTPADDGKEVFAYVPKTVIPNLSMLGNKNYGTSVLYHQYYVDGPLVETDAFVNAPGASTASWRNYLVGTLGAGGRAVFALDVTGAPTLGASSVRWELNSASNSDVGYITAPVEVGVLPNGDWVALFGNGRFSTAGKATLFVVNLQTGVAQTLDVDTTGSNGLGGVGVVRNGTGQITTLYAGDLKGKVWKFDYTASASSRFQISGGAAFFTAAHTDGTAQPITEAPIMFDHSKGGKIVVFGTGRLSTETDAADMSTQAIYGVWDKTGDTVTRPMSRTALLQPRALSTLTGAGNTTYYQLSGIPVNWDGGERGWVINLDLPSGMRVLYPSQRVSSKIVMVSAVKPASSGDVCEPATGTGINLLIPVEDGLNPTYPFFDTNDSGTINSSDAIVAGYGTNADGVDAIVRGVTTTTVTTTTSTVNGTSVTSTTTQSDTTISIQNTTGQKTAVIKDSVTGPSGGGGPVPRVVKDRLWRRILNPPIR